MHGHRHSARHRAQTYERQIPVELLARLLVPMGLTEIRIALFPWLYAPGRDVQTR